MLQCEVVAERAPLLEREQEVHTSAQGLSRPAAETSAGFFDDDDGSPMTSCGAQTEQHVGSKNDARAAYP